MGDGNLSVFGSAPPPDKDDVLFRSDKDLEADARIGCTVADWLYCTGFRRAAQRLVEHVCDTGNDQDFLIYPIVYLYRHHTELVLKSIFESASGLLDRALTQDERRTLGRHDLLALWQATRPLLNPICDRADSPPFPAAELDGIDSCIRQLHEQDPNGQHFRYATMKTESARGTGTKVPSRGANLKPINVRAFADSMDRLVSCLEGIEWWFSDLEDAHAELKRNAIRS
jgi:hypothetical protein